MAALRRDPIGLTTGTQGSSMPVIYSNMHGFGIRFQEIDTDTFAGQARDLQQHAWLQDPIPRDRHGYVGWPGP